MDVDVTTSMTYSNSLDVLSQFQEIVVQMVSEGLVYSNVSSIALRVSQEIVENIQMSSVQTLTPTFIVFVNETVQFNNNIFETARVEQFVQTLFRTKMVIYIDGQLFEAYCVNLENNALTRYHNYNFDSFCQFKKDYFGINKNGIYVFGGQDDDGEDIKGKIQTGYFNIANGDSKNQGFSSLRLAQNRLQCAYLLITNTNQMIFRVITDDKKIYDYTVNEEYDNEKLRVNIGKGIRSSAFKFELHTTGQFSLKDCTVIPIVLDRKV